MLQAIRRAVPVDAVWFATADPHTLLFTGGISDPDILPAAPMFMRNELMGNDVNKFFQLAQAHPPVSSLFAATDGRMESSPRYRDILEPLHLGDELRVALVGGRLCWGYMCLHREGRSPPFNAQEAAFMASLSPVLADGLRASLNLDDRGVPEPEGGPGLIILGPDLEFTAANQPARAWLDQAAEEEWHRGYELPPVVLAVAGQLMSRRPAGGARAAVPTARMRTRTGGWLGVRASRLSGPGMQDAIAVVLEPPPTSEVLPLLAQTHALTGREAEVVRLVIRGLSTAQLSIQLHISESTVQDHMKSIFDKVGVRSRRELVAQLTARSYRGHSEGGD